MAASLTAHQRWQKRTGDGRAMAAGWSTARHTPPRVAQYEVRGHDSYTYLTWAYDQWWHQEVGGSDSGQWTGYGAARYSWRGPRWDACRVNWGSVIVQAAAAGNAEAQREVEACRQRNETERLEREARWREEGVR